MPAVAWCYMLLINVLQSRLLRKAAKAAAKLFKFELPRDFSSTWVVRRGFGRGFHFPNTNLRASRQVCELMLRSKVQDALRHRESMQPFINHPHLDLLDSLIKALEELVPHLLPNPSSEEDESTLYRFVLDHGDFGIHNMTISQTDTDDMRITSVFD